MKTIFKTSVIGIATWLRFNGLISSYYKNPNGRVDWVFVSSDALYELLDLYNRDIKVPIKSYTETLAKVRSEMLSARDAKYIKTGEGQGEG